MTEPTPTDENRKDSHLDEDALSAVIDGDGDGVGAAHLLECSACRERLEAMRAAAALVATPVELDPDQREATIAAVLDSAPAAAVVTLPTRSSRSWSWLAPAAAVAAVVGLMASVAIGLGGGRDDSQEASLDASSGEAEVMTSTTAAAQTAPDSGPVQQLGPQDEGSLRDAVRQRLRPTPEDSPSGSGAEESADDVSGDDQRVATCDATLRSTDPTLGLLRLTARARWVGQPALILAYQVSGDITLGVRVFVVTPATCFVRASQSFAP